MFDVIHGLNLLHPGTRTQQDAVVLSTSRASLLEGHASNLQCGATGKLATSGSTFVEVRITVLTSELL